jgi:hypothetical protein
MQFNDQVCTANKRSINNFLVGLADMAVKCLVHNNLGKTENPAMNSAIQAGALK